MNWPEVAAAAAPHLDLLQQQAMRTSLLLFAFLGCVLIFAYVFLKKFPSRSPFRWIVALAALAVFVIIRAGGLGRPDVVVLAGAVQRIEKQELTSRWWLHMTQARQYVLRRDSEPFVVTTEYVSMPCLEQLAAELRPGTEETLILMQGQAVGLRRNGQTKIFLPLPAVVKNNLQNTRY